MSLKTFTTLAPTELFEYSAAYAKVYSAARQDFLSRLLSGEKEDDIVKIIQANHGLNKRQVNSIKSEVKGAISSARECRERHIKILKGQIESCKKYIKSQEKRVKDYRKAQRAKKFKQSCIKDACNLAARRRKTTQLQDALFGIHQKKRRLAVLETKLEHVKRQPLRLNLGVSGTDFFMVGSKGESAGNQICQLDTSGNIKLRVPSVLEDRFGEYVTVTSVNFPYGQQHIDAALKSEYVDTRGQVHKTCDEALTFRFYCRNFVWYIAITFVVPEVPTQSKKRRQAGCIGVDINPGVIGWTKVDKDGNLEDSGQSPLNLHSKSSNQSEAILSDIAARLVTIAESYHCPIVIDNLEFTAKKSQLRERGTRYARMLSGFAYSKWQAVLEARCNSRGIELVLVNPAHSSQIGLHKFMSMYGLSSDTAAAMVLARRAIRFSERLPKSYIRIPSKFAYLPDSRKHVWSHWNAVCRGLSLGSRHQYFTTSPNRTRKVKLLGVPERGGLVASQLTLFDLGAIPNGSPNAAASVGRSRRSRGKAESAFTQISLDFN